ncbi:hypothetical protein BJF85_23140 [Saccharomonospora sp. CUA-673]|uniref:TetR/AcrR family transcriptional regulator n=1 Tax=Saccharomonospora sp. CUA-673 TaxID=1904969 RepID=UPI00095B4809|nr:TetR/AcrR family transcriptional regulator [Saccharomonospora sp. CUA-673]OLT42353.1 hypothetical protein BJF85_23140 [Saccharomonospora sp. CUA-673]
MDTPRKHPRQQRSRATVEAVLEAAAQVFEREGMAATTNRIAERAGFSIGTVYQYFPNKHAILAALAERHIDDAATQLRATFAELDAANAGWKETVHAVCTTLARLHADRPRLHTVLYDLAPRVPEGVARLHTLHAETTAAVAAALRRCGADTGVDPEHTAALVVHTAEATLHRVLLTDSVSDSAPDPVSSPASGPASGADVADIAERLAATLLALVPAPTR